MGELQPALSGPDVVLHDLSISPHVNVINSRHDRQSCFCSLSYLFSFLLVLLFLPRLALHEYCAKMHERLEPVLLVCPAFLFLVGRGNKDADK